MTSCTSTSRPRWPHRTATTDDGPLDLGACFVELNKRYFGASLPKYRLTYVDADELQGADGRFLGDEIQIRRGMPRDKTRGALLHELCHGWQFDGPAGNLLNLQDPHDAAFRKVAAMIDPDRPPRTSKEALHWQPVNPSGRVAAPATATRSAGGRVRALRTGVLNDYSRPSGDQSLRVVKGRQYEASHWAVQSANPGWFE